MQAQPRSEARPETDQEPAVSNTEPSSRKKLVIQTERTLAKYSTCDSQSEFMTVLLVEDHTDTRSVLGMLLNRCGYQTVTAKSLKEARTRLQEMPFDIVISDLNLPDGDGLDLVREAKQTHKLKTIAVTGRTSDENATED